MMITSSGILNINNSNTYILNTINNDNIIIRVNYCDNISNNNSIDKG